MNRDIHAVRRLMNAGKYDEARILLQETKHPGVARMYRELEIYLAAQEANQAARIGRMSPLIALGAGLTLVLMALAAGIFSVLFLLLLFLIGAVLGFMIAEIYHPANPRGNFRPFRSRQQKRRYH